MRIRRGLAFAALTWIPTLHAQDSTRAARRTLAKYEQEVRFADLMLAMEQRYRASERVFRHVNIVDVVAGRVMPNVRVEIRDGRIAAMRPDASAGVQSGEIDGSGRYLSPGLVDMHVHQFRVGEPAPPACCDRRHDRPRHERRRIDAQMA